MPTYPHNKQIMKILVILVYLTLLSGCYCSIQVSKTKLHSFHKIETGFQISKITVDSFTSNEIPLNFTRDTTIRCFPYCYEYASELEYKAINGENSVFIDTCNFKPSRNIYFNKPNADYEWAFFIPFEPKNSYDILPLKFIKGNWYEIKNICDPYFFIYIYVMENNNWKIKKVERW